MTEASVIQPMQSGGCLVLAPGLLSSVAITSSMQRTEHLCRLLGFAEQVQIPASEILSVESLVARSLLLAQQSTCAALLTHQHDFPATEKDHQRMPVAATVLRADPAYQQIDMNNATLGNPQELEITAAECTALLQTLNHHFAVDGIRFECQDPSRWYCHFETLPQVITTPLSAAIGRDVAACRPTGADARQWRSKLAEIEMLLFEHEVNVARQNSNKLPVNTLWLWGEGCPEGYPQHGSTESGVSVYTDNFYVQSVADYVGIDCHALPDKPGVLQAKHGPALLVVDKFTHQAAAGGVGEAEHYAKSLQWFEQTICEQLWRGLQAGGWSEVTLWLGDDRLFRLPKSVKKQFFRRLFTRLKPLSAYLPDNPMSADPSLMQRS